MKAGVAFTQDLHKRKTDVSKCSFQVYFVFDCILLFYPLIMCFFFLIQKIEIIEDEEDVSEMMPSDMEQMHSLLDLRVNKQKTFLLVCYLIFYNHNIISLTYETNVHLCPKQVLLFCVAYKRLNI